MRTTFLKIIVIAMMVLSITSCKKWVDAPAPLTVSQSTLFQNEQGFRDALNGVYIQMGTMSLYGRDLNFGLMAVLGRSYDTTISASIGNLYYQGAQYNFQDPTVKITVKNIWDSMYFCIANLNNVLANTDANKSVFAGTDYNLIKGEAMGLRAFLHFELLRMFAPAPNSSTMGLPAIPYVKQISPYATPVSSIGGVLDSCVSELLTAKSLLSDADLTTSRFTSWAVKGLLARLYLYKGDLVNAQTYALSIINSNQFPLSTTNTDLWFDKEHLFSLYSYQFYSGGLIKSVLNTTPALGFTITNQTALYVTGSGSTGDWRKVFNDPATSLTSGNTISPRKYYATNANIVPMIRMTEMYYIAAECANANNDSTSATAWLDTVRVHRNLPRYTLTALRTDSINTEIRKEYQKEFLGEGQMFYFYKRKNLGFSALPYGRVPVVSGATYFFTKPE